MNVERNMTVDASSFRIMGGPQAQVVTMPTVEAPPPGLPPAPVPMGAANRVGAPESLPAHDPAPMASATTGQVEDAEEVEDTEAEAAPAEAAPADQRQESAAQRAARFAALARKEADLHRARQQLKAEREALNAQRTAAPSWDSIRSEAAQDPLAVLERLGITYEGLTDRILSGNVAPAKDPVAEIREDVARLREEQKVAQERLERVAQERLAAEQSAVIDQFRKDATDFVRANRDKYELTAARGKEHLVARTVEDHFMATGQLLPLTTAAELVEKYQEADLAAVEATQKFQARMAAVRASQPAGQTKQAATTPAPKRPTTLSNAFTASATAPAATRPRTDSERVAAALARLNGG